MRADHFNDAKRIVGVDINRGCRLIEFRDPRIQPVIGDITAAESQAVIGAIHPDYDLMVEDASHRSYHMVDAFLRLLPRLRPCDPLCDREPVLQLLAGIGWRRTSPGLGDELPQAAERSA